MANDLNQCNFIGRLGADPETRSTPTGVLVVNFRIACGWKSKDKEGAEWIGIVAFGKLAEICDQYLKKGSRVFISGKFRTREWEKDGVKRYTSEIIADQMQMLDSRPEGERQSGSGYAPPSGQGDRNHAPPPPSNDYGIFDDDIPFDLFERGTFA